jgi:hypothetical protein
MTQINTITVLEYFYRLSRIFLYLYFVVTLFIIEFGLYVWD